MALSDNMRGALLMMGSMTAFTVNDAFIKAAADVLPFFQALFLRSVGVIILLVILCKVLGQWRLDFSRRDWLLIWSRAGAEAAGAMFFLTALFNMPIANVSAILQALPLTVSLAGALFLGEALGWRRLTAILVGFCGVLLIVQPGGAEFTGYSLSAVAAVACVTLRDLLVRRMSADIPSTMVALAAVVVITGISAIGAVFTTWVPVSGLTWAQLVGAMAFIIGGYVFSVAAMRVGDISFVAPFRYTSLVVALVLGVLVFGEIPNSLTMLGAVIVVLTGLFTLYRETKLAARKNKIAGRLR